MVEVIVKRLRHHDETKKYRGQYGEIIGRFKASVSLRANGGICLVVTDSSLADELEKVIPNEYRG